jgi:DnaK suppressor protein
MHQKEDIDFIKEMLYNQLEGLLGSASHMVTELLYVGEKFTDAVDQATFESNRRTTLRIKDRESRLIHKIRNTLKLIEEGNFGICENCGEEIDIARLKARPVTTHCIQCKIKMEAEEKIHQLPY